MVKKLRVTLYRRKGQRIYQMQYRDPVTRKKVRRSTDCSKEREAERAAARWEHELSEGLPADLTLIPWAEFRRRYEDEVCSSLAIGTDHKIASVFNVLERAMKPKLLTDVDADMLSQYAAWMRNHGRKESTIKGHLAHIMAALGWARDHNLIAKVPKVKMPKRARKSKVMKGRPITTEEFERMLDKVPAGVLSQPVREERSAAIVESWRFYLRGMWASGLRLTESMELHWSDPSKLRVVDLSKSHPMLLIPGELEKGNEDRILPMPPEFAELLRAVPASQRGGYVFNPLAQRDCYTGRLTAFHVGTLVTKFGEKAAVVVDRSGGRVKYASAHNLRRSFGARWAPLVMPATLRELMRHESIETTMRYYVGANAKSTAAALWEAHRGRADLGASLGATQAATF